MWEEQTSEGHSHLSNTRLQVFHLDILGMLYPSVGLFVGGGTFGNPTQLNVRASPKCGQTLLGRERHCLEQVGILEHTMCNALPTTAHSLKACGMAEGVSLAASQSC